MQRILRFPVVMAGLILLAGLWLAQAAVSWLEPVSNSEGCPAGAADDRPVLVAEAPRHCPEPTREPARAAGRGEPTLAPPEPVELCERGRVIVVQVEAEQAADESDVLQR